MLAAINPLYGIGFLLQHGAIGLVTLGAVFLVVTGGEALYADLGHFGRKPIQTAWLGLVLPALADQLFWSGREGAGRSRGDRKSVLSAGAGYFPAADGRVGDGRDGDREPGGYHRRIFTGPSGNPAWVYCRGLTILHTSASHVGQIYIPRVTMALMIGVLLLVGLFRTSSALASAYGIAVATTMVVDGILGIRRDLEAWQWPLWKARC